MIYIVWNFLLFSDTLSPRTIHTEMWKKKSKNRDQQMNSDWVEFFVSRFISPTMALHVQTALRRKCTRQLDYGYLHFIYLWLCVCFCLIAAAAAAATWVSFLGNFLLFFRDVCCCCRFRQHWIYFFLFERSGQTS